jgi:hypothetical protein
MNPSEYWWDRSGPADPDIRRLERALSPLGYRSPRRHRIGLLQAGLSLAAALLLVWAAGPDDPLSGRESWRLTVLAGNPHADGRTLAGTDLLGVGQWLTTGPTAAVDLSVGAIGHVRIEPGSRLRILTSTPSVYRIQLEEGMIHAAVWAPPRQFVVETPAARAVDLGCEFTLAVDARGHGMLCVETGWVALESHERSSLVPSGAQCEMRPGVGPGTPYLAGASPDYLELLRAFDFESGSAAHVEALIDQASPCDAFSLVYLVQRVEPSDRGRIFDRVTELYPPWQGITRAGIVSLESAAVKGWQDQFECFESEVCRASCLPEWL